MLINGDCLNALDHIKKESVNLVYLDPPFFTCKKHKQSSKNNSTQYAFDDRWNSLDEYIKYMECRLRVLHKTIKKNGSIFLHCDKSASHYLRASLDRVFGHSSFQSEIIWSYRRWSNAKKGLLNSHQVIFFYSKSKDFQFNHMYQDYSPTTNIDQIFQERKRNKHGKSAYKINENNKPVLMQGKKGVPLSDVWEIPYLNPKAKERVGYPTQKPIILLEQIIKLVTNKGDLVFDPFCGSGTTLVAAELLDRKYCGMDISKNAISLTKKRLKNPIKSESVLLSKGKKAYLNQSDQVLRILKSLGAYPVQRNAGIDGFLKDNEEIKPIPIKIQQQHESLEDAKRKILKACEKNHFKEKILVSSEISENQVLADKNLYIFKFSDSLHESLEDTFFNSQSFIPGCDKDFT